MSPGDRLRAALLARLMPLGRVFDSVPARAAMPFAVVEDAGLRADDAVGVSGRWGMIAVTCRDGPGPPERVRALASAVEAAAATVPPDLGGGWRLTAIGLARGGVTQGKDGGWTATGVFAVRLYRAN